MPLWGPIVVASSKDKSGAILIFMSALDTTHMDWQYLEQDIWVLDLFDRINIGLVDCSVVCCKLVYVH